MATRRRFSRECKVEAVRLVRERDLGLHVNVLRGWVREKAADPTQAFPGHGQQKSELAELTQWSAKRQQVWEMWKAGASASRCVEHGRP